MPGRDRLTVPIVTVTKDREAHAAMAAERLASAIQQSCARRGRARVCFTGGRTAQRVYHQLADSRRAWREQIAWAGVHAFWGDERHVPSQHVDSNVGMTQRALLSHVPIPSNQIHPMRGDLADAAVAAREYDRVLPVTVDVMLLSLAGC